MTNENFKLVLINENVNIPVTVTNSKDYILEGIAAVFNKENENGRIYTWEEYKPHISYLQEKIKKKKLVGEMDHPEGYETSLRSMTHIVEKLWYDEKDDVLRIRIRLLDTEPHGMNARKLVEAGFPLSISSRAAGSVGQNKKVKINHIFAFDLVADGGFGDFAELESVMEGLSINPDKYKKIKNEKCLNGFCGITNENLEVIDVSEKYPFINENTDFSKIDFNKKNTAKKILDMEIKEKDLTEKAMQQFSIFVKEEFNTLNSKIKKLEKELKEKEQIDISKKADKKDVYNLIAYSNKLAEAINSKEVVNKDESTVAELKETLNNLIGYTNKLAEEIQDNRNYTSGPIRESIEKVIKFNEANYNIIEETVNNMIEHNDSIVETVNHLANHNDLIVENVNNHFEYTEKMRKLINEGIEYSELIAESVNNKEFKSSEKLEESKQNINEQNINEKIDVLIEKLKSKKADDQNTPDFVKTLNESQVKIYNDLLDPQKETVGTLIKESKTFEEAVKTVSNDESLFISAMPEDLKKSWEKLDENKKSNIIKRSKKYNLDTDYQIRYFWSLQNLETVEENPKINENKEVNLKQKINLGYDSSYIEDISKMMEKYQ